MSSRTYRVRGVARPALSAWTRGVNSGEWDRPSGEDAALVARWRALDATELW